MNKHDEPGNGGINDQTPSLSTYFTWNNNCLEGATTGQTLNNLDFFQWLQDEYGLVLDIYTFDTGALDCYGASFYGHLDSERTQRQFPGGFGPIVQKAANMGTRLGIWCGPDGFGDTPKEEAARIKQMVDLCRIYRFKHFKLDGCCGPLREEKDEAFIRMVTECRKFSPDLIVQNHCINLYRAMPLATTAFWGNSEMYIDSMISNSVCAPHHRAAAMARGLVPGMQRLLEDHGVCLSSCLDGWDDEMGLTAFGRDLILSPEIYGSPWLLRDDEYPKLARLFNLHRRYGDILVDGLELPEQYGPHAAARGDAMRRFIILRNLTWTGTAYPIKLDGEIGLAPGKDVELLQLHPTEKLLGIFPYGATVLASVEPFRACLLYAGTVPCEEPGVSGVDYQVIRNLPGQPVEIELLGLPGSSASLSLLGEAGYKSARLDGNEVNSLLSGPITVDFPGEPYAKPFHRKIADFRSVAVPADAAALYEATVFAADNNAMEIRSFERARGWSAIPQVRRAQEAFFRQPDFLERGLWDKNLFDGRPDTGFWPCPLFRGIGEVTVDAGCFRLDLDEICAVDELVLNTGDRYGLAPMCSAAGYQAYVSTDLVSWRTVRFLADVNMHIPVKGRMRYFKMGGNTHGINVVDAMPGRLISVKGYQAGQELDPTQWRASNLFRANLPKVQKAWQADITLDEVAPGSILCIAIQGKHGIEGAYAAAKIGGAYAGCPDRAPSYPANNFIYKVIEKDSNYTYYLPLDASARGKLLEVFVLACDQENPDLQPELWITARQAPFQKRKLVLDR